jgi:Glycosyltransferase family 87
VKRVAGATDAAAAAACLLLAVSFYVLQRWLEQGQLADIPVYANYAGLVRGGQVPYRDFAFEYPPTALPALLVPSWLPWSYATSFAVLMGVCGAGCVVAASSALRAVRAGGARAWAALLAIGVSPIVLGSLFDTRYDLWPTLLAIGAVATVVRERPVATGALLGLGFAAKLWPGVLLPLAVAYLWRRRGRREALVALAAFVLAAAACFLPFVVLSPGGVASSLRSQLERPLQVESLGAAVLMAAQHLGMRPLATVNASGGQALTGRGADLAADLSTALELASVIAVWVVFSLRRSVDAESLLAAAAGAVAALVAFDKVLSPQYLIWLVPLVAVVRGARGITAGILLLAALGLTQTWFPWSYWPLALEHASPWSWYLLARDLALVALAAVLVVGLRPARDSAGGREGWPAARRAAA